MKRLGWGLAVALLLAASAASAALLLRGSGGAPTAPTIVDILPHSASIQNSAASGTTVAIFTCVMSDNSTPCPPSGSGYVWSMANQPTFLSLNQTTGALTTTATNVPACTPTQDNCTFPVTIGPPPPVSTVCGGSPPPAAQRAGYTNLVWCIDGSDPKRATISDWIDCNNTGNQNSGTGVFPLYDFWYFQRFGGCKDWSQATDPSTGKTTLLFHWLADTDPGGGDAWDGMSSGQVCCSGKPFYGRDFPAMGYYFEIRYRQTPIVNDFLLAEQMTDFYTYCVNEPSGNVDSRCIGPNSDPLEYDNPEAYGGRDGSAAAGGVGGCCAAGQAGSPPFGVLYSGAYCSVTGLASCGSTLGGVDPTAQTTYGWMTTTDGTSAEICAYINDQHYTHSGVLGGAPNGCSMVTPATGNFTSRMYASFWLGATYGPHTGACTSYSGNGNNQLVLGATNNGSGLIRLFVQSDTGAGIPPNTPLGSITTATVSGTASHGVNADGTWNVTIIDPQHVDLQGSTFSGTYSGGSPYPTVLYNGKLPCALEGGQPDTYNYVEFIRFWSCPGMNNYYVPPTGTDNSSGATNAYDTAIPCKSGLIQ